MSMWRIDPRFGLALILLSAVGVAGTRKAEPCQNGGQTPGAQAQTPPQGPPPRAIPSKPPAAGAYGQERRSRILCVGNFEDSLKGDSKWQNDLSN